MDGFRWVCDGTLLPGSCQGGVTDFPRSRGVGRFECPSCNFDLCEACAHEDAEVLCTPTTAASPSGPQAALPLDSRAVFRERERERERLARAP